MKIHIKRALIFTAAFSAFTGAASAKKVDIRRLLWKPAAYDNKVVEVKAEAVGLLRRKDGFWLNVTDGRDLGVWIEKGRKHITLPAHFAGYRQRGDVVYIKGVFHASCLRHGGETDIHALALKVLRQGGREKETVSPDKKIFIAIMLGIFLVCAMFFFSQQRLWKKKLSG